ncbi:MAG: hypothetical protein P4L56_29135 [Candidatus Sulfopaludibacter sp.]|nr:hypothetical protein [Candidatus Sulfopaludibacter sp.]
MNHESRLQMRLARIEVLPMGERTGKIVLLPPAEIAYAFLGSSAPRELVAIGIERGWRFDPARVYVRTGRGIYWTPYRRLTKLTRELAMLGEEIFYPISRALVVNALKISSLDTSGRTPLLLFDGVDGRTEMLTVTRRAWKLLRERLRLRRRHGVADAGDGKVGAAGDASQPARRNRNRKAKKKAAE